ncbi:hypothetical protein AGLY_000024 [Aphis glycines]|uniref:Uncharacterized protein n=1 Tax=Aphis glycines TaxID=307491 RepID=A0A6G0U6B6_APHGL|nr:hypothetical protein AGLY_000024 [Aphis glycines]
MNDVSQLLTNSLIVDSERSDKCIDFIMLCVFFFVSVYTRRMCRNNASIFNFSSFSGLKVNLVGALGGHSLKFPIIFKSTRKIKKKLRKNGNFYAKPVFDQINFFIWFVYSSNFYDIYRKRENLQRNNNDLSSNDFKYLLLFKKYKSKILENFTIMIHTAPNVQHSGTHLPAFFKFINVINLIDLNLKFKVSYLDQLNESSLVPNFANSLCITNALLAENIVNHLKKLLLIYVQVLNYVRKLFFDMLHDFNQQYRFFTLFSLFLNHLFFQLIQRGQFQ